MVDTLSRKALRMQSKSMSSSVSRHMSPLLNSISRTLQNSKMPLLARSATITIMPHSSASVLWSIQPMIVYTLGSLCSSARMNSTHAAPMNAISVR